MKKLTVFILIVATLTLTFGTLMVSAGFGTGVQTIADEVKIIKSGLFGRKITFSDADFKQGLCISEFETVKITKLPPSTEGTLMLAGRRVGEGSVIKRKNLPALVFIPANKDVAESKFLFTIDGYASGAEIEFVLRFTDKINYEPEIKKESVDSLSLKTQREIGIHGKMYASDAENDKIEYIIVSYPKSGTLTMVNKTTGEYIYTPKDSYVGADSFVYVARDEWGNYSKTQKVSVTVTDRISEVEYRDMQNRPEYNAAVTMTGMGIMAGKLIGDGVYFNPDENVSRAEFVAMAMKVLGIRQDTTLTETFFDDNADIPSPLLSYVATAQRTGIISGTFKDGKLLFSPNGDITKYEAAVIMANLLDTEATGEVPAFSDVNTVPVWARASVYAMCSLGIFDKNSTTIDGNSSVTRAECATYLYRMIDK